MQKKYFKKYFNPNQDLTAEQKELVDLGTELINKRKNRKKQKKKKKCPNKKLWTEKKPRKTGWIITVSPNGIKQFYQEVVRSI